MFIWWGPEQINIYNDAYIPILGARHPRALGQLEGNGEGTHIEVHTPVPARAQHGNRWL
jgi:hypothetical protein